jgi:hypothetical protein
MASVDHHRKVFAASLQIIGIDLVIRGDRRDLLDIAGWICHNRSTPPLAPSCRQHPLAKKEIPAGGIGDCLKMKVLINRNPCGG